MYIYVLLSRIDVLIYFDILFCYVLMFYIIIFYKWLFLKWVNVFSVVIYLYFYLVSMFVEL